MTDQPSKVVPDSAIRWIEVKGAGPLEYWHGEYVDYTLDVIKGHNGDGWSYRVNNTGRLNLASKDEAMKAAVEDMNGRLMIRMTAAKKTMALYAQTPAPQGGGEALQEVVSALEATLARPACEYLRIERKGAQVLLAALKPQTPDVLGEAGWVEWHGGDDPFPGKSVAIKLRCGIISSSGPGLYRWRHYGQPTPSDIVAYRATPPGDVLGGEGEGR